jgi:hypothetical protein
MIMNINAILGIAGTTLGFLGLICSLFAIRAIRGWRARCLIVESSLAAVRSELDTATSLSVKAGLRIKRIEQEYSGVTDRVDLVELRGSVQSFDQAIDSARRGADSGKLTQQFGLSRGEADLVARLHGRKKSA